MMVKLMQILKAKMTKIALISLILGFRSGLILGYQQKRIAIRYLSSSSSSSSSSTSSPLSSITSSSSSSCKSSHAILKREYEEKLFKNGYRYIIGCDEAGRGPLAGPVIAAAVCIPSSSSSSSFLSASQHQIIDTVRDSKLLSEKKREEIYNLIMNDKTIIKSFTVIDNDKIDEINILNAALLAMQLSIEKITQQIQNDPITDNNICALIDGNKLPKNILFKAIPVVKGDQLVYSIALASIIAKVERDRIMTEMHNLYPQYDFIKHKGYPTKHHFLMLDKYGPCSIHRKSTKPVQRILYNKKEL